MNFCKLLLFVTCFIIVQVAHSQCIITLKPNAVQGKDAYITNISCNASYVVGNPGAQCISTNLGNSKYNMAKVWTMWGTHTAMRSLLEFDLSSIPAGCTVQHAELILYNDAAPSGYHCGANSTIHPCISNEMKLHRVTEPWHEMQVTWLNQPAFAVTTAGADFVYVPNNDLPYNHYNIDLTDMVNYWLTNPSANFGFVMKQIDETTHYKTVTTASSDHPNSDFHPELVLTLSCPGGCNNQIQGYVYDDTNGDCVQDSADLPLENWIVEILPGPTYVSTDSNGFYHAWVMDGAYTVNQLIPNNIIWDSICPMPYQYQLSLSGGSTINADFSVEADVYCPILEVDVSSNFLRKCHTENFIVQYCNNGNQMAQGAYIDVNFSNGLTPLLSDLPYTVNAPDEWSFYIGDIAANECGSFYVTVQVSCTAEFGDYECVTATIFPEYTCASAPVDSSTWDRSSVMVVGACSNDSLACFTITNTGDPGDGDMQGPSEYRIYENNVLVFTGTFQLAGAASQVICWPVGPGNSIRLEADQRPGHPGNSHPNDVVENCGSNSSQYNFGGSLPEDDAAAHVAQDCGEVRSSYDPNDKQVIPSGVGAAHYVDQNVMLDYKIRFQNTGNDTAFLIVIRDTLSAHLDINSIQVGASSHNYSYSIDESRVLTFRFENIMLPDSNVNEPLSHGFVKFKINQMPDLAIGTVINNSAAIYFDFNPPVITNNTFLEIGDMTQILPVQSNYLPKVEINVYPNPFNQQATVSLRGYEEKESIVFELFNALGQKVKEWQSSNRQFEIDRNNLPAGLYFYQCRAGKSILGTGKLMLNEK